MIKKIEILHVYLLIIVSLSVAFFFESIETLQIQTRSIQVDYNNDIGDVSMKIDEVKMAVDEVKMDIEDLDAKVNYLLSRR